ncbi:hypothetical protein ACFZBE_19505 [Streptomyces sp. NPDC008061]|jgi:hypothetical protein|uniref:hypothetical protein n=1 Tax=Streptomyces sp. NPDC008061 TaxID=3364805 RepID=UPI0036EF1CB0
MISVLAPPRISGGRSAGRQELSFGSVGGGSVSEPAGLDGTAACDDALVSYDLAVWNGDCPIDEDQAGSTYDELYERYLESDEVVVPPVTRIAAYVEALIARYPDDIDRNVVWASPPVINEASGPIVYLLMSYGKAEEVSEYAAALAREHGLVCFDPQGECLRP